MPEALANDWVETPNKNNTFEGWPPKVFPDVGGFEVVIGMWPAREGDLITARPGLMVDGVIVDDRPEYIVGNDDDPRPSLPVSVTVDRLIIDFNDKMPKAIDKAYSRRVMDFINARVDVDEHAQLVNTN
ncbi:MAG: hypothetical protein V2I66_08080 [Halieaceae bacterium]|jgi:hypothetical protein|nr:hypothetical protein [Halieaceae bacterium]